MNKELRRCPFCGGEARPYGDGFNDFYWVECVKCRTESRAYDSVEESIEAWNRRKPLEDIVEQLEEIQMGEYSAKAEYVQGMNGNSIAYCDGAINTIEKAIEIVKGGTE